MGTDLRQGKNLFLCIDEGTAIKLFCSMMKTLYFVPANAPGSFYPLLLLLLLLFVAVVAAVTLVWVF